jgi:hypothetical protein
MSSGRYDHAARRRSQRHRRQRGCLVYLPAEELAKTGIDMHGPPPAYRVWGAPRGRVVIQLYREQ